MATHLIRALAPLVLAAGATLAAAGGVAASDPVGATVRLVTGCTSVTQGASCRYTFQVMQGAGRPYRGCAVTFGSAGPGDIAPLAATTSNSGEVTTTFTASGSEPPGTAVLTAECNEVAAFATAHVQSATLPARSAAAAPGATTAGAGSSGLPNPALYLGLGLGVMVLLGGAVSIRRSRVTAS